MYRYWQVMIGLIWMTYQCTQGTSDREMTFLRTQVTFSYRLYAELNTTCQIHVIDKGLVTRWVSNLLFSFAVHPKLCVREK